MEQLLKVGQLRSQSIVALTIRGLAHYPRPLSYEAFPLSFDPPPLEIFRADVP